MMNIAILRLVGGIVAISLGMAALWWVADKIGDAREAKVRAEYEAAIDDANTDTAAANAAATKVAERDARVRAQAVAAAKSAMVGQCLLTAPEAAALGAIR